MEGEGPLRDAHIRRYRGPNQAAPGCGRGSACICVVALKKGARRTGSTPAHLFHRAPSSCRHLHALAVLEFEGVARGQEGDLIQGCGRGSAESRPSLPHAPTGGPLLRRVGSLRSMNGGGPFVGASLLANLPERSMQRPSWNSSPGVSVQCASLIAPYGSLRSADVDLPASAELRQKRGRYRR